jgi:hypothetical protein
MSATMKIAKSSDESKSPKLRAPDERLKLFQFALYDNLVNEFATSIPEASAKIRDIMMFYVNMPVDEYQRYAQNMNSKTMLITLRKEMKHSTKPPKPTKKTRAKKEQTDNDKPKRTYKKKLPAQENNDATNDAPAPTAEEQPTQDKKRTYKKRLPKNDTDTVAVEETDKPAAEKKERKPKKTAVADNAVTDNTVADNAVTDNTVDDNTVADNAVADNTVAVEVEKKRVQKKKTTKQPAERIQDTVNELANKFETTPETIAA